MTLKTRLGVTVTNVNIERIRVPIRLPLYYGHILYRFLDKVRLVENRDFFFILSSTTT